ncbi:MAG: cupin domain-containing protein [Myxococcales bacterium]|nr:cupin domain-containing protein [Myxococcales bacterium]
MTGVRRVHIDDVEPYVGPNQIPGIRFRAVRQALGVRAWGMNVLELEPGVQGYPEHDHVGDGQEEVYLVLEGSVALHAQGQILRLTRGDMVCVAPEVTRKLVTEGESARILAIGGTVGKPYREPGHE